MNRELLVIALIVFVTSLFTRSVDPVVPLIADGLTVAGRHRGAAVDRLRAALCAGPAAARRARRHDEQDPADEHLPGAAGAVRLRQRGRAELHRAVRFPRCSAGIASGGIFPDLARDRRATASRWRSARSRSARLLAATMTGNLLGASVAGIVGDLAGWRAVFIVVGGLGLIVAVVGADRLSQRAAGKAPRASTCRPSVRTIAPSSATRSPKSASARCSSSRSWCSASFRTWRRSCTRPARRAPRSQASCWRASASASVCYSFCVALDVATPGRAQADDRRRPDDGGLLPDPDAAAALAAGIR